MIASNCLQIAAREVVLAKQRHLRAELRDAGRHLIADAHHVADVQAGHDVDIDAAHVGGGRTIEVADLEIALVDRLVALAILAAGWPMRPPRCVGAVLERRRRRHREAIDGPLAGAGERERLRRRIGRPRRRQLQRELTVDRAFVVVEQVDLDGNLLHRRAHRNDRVGRRDVSASAGTTRTSRTRRRTAAWLAAAHRLADLHRHPAHRVAGDGDGRRRRRRPAEVGGRQQRVAILANRLAREIRPAAERDVGGQASR